MYQTENCVLHLHIYKNHLWCRGWCLVRILLSFLLAIFLDSCSSAWLDKLGFWLFLEGRNSAGLEIAWTVLLKKMRTKVQTPHSSATPAQPALNFPFQFSVSLAPLSSHFSSCCEIFSLSIIFVLISSHWKWVITHIFQNVIQMKQLHCIFSCWLFQES